MEDELMVRYISRKKEEGLELLVETYGGLITSIVRTQLGSLKNYEEECVNDILLGIWTNIDRFDDKKNTFKNWIAAVAKYKAIDYKRKYVKSQHSKSLTEVEGMLGDDYLALQKELKEEVNELLSHLNERDRELFKSYYLEDVALENIAVKRNTTISNLYNRLSRGRKKLKEIFK
ncbi:sigma-70 family RNA polymerase sigma factor [Priestia megaterium]|nr:sigma-70 family RNA polymerase sigma factor [Priestia megaterium]